MSLINISLLILATLFSVYSCFCSIECARALGLWKPHLILNKKIKVSPPNMSNESVVLFFAVGFAGFATLFSRVSSHWHPVILPMLELALFSLLIRYTLVTHFFHKKSPASMPSWVKLLFVVVSFTVPLSLSAAGVYLLTGQFFYKTITGWLLEIGALLGILSVGVSWLGGRRGLSQILFGSWLLTLGLLLPVHLQMVGSNLLSYPFALWLSLLAVAAATIIATDRLETRSYLKYSAAAVGLITPVFLVFSNSPYLIAHQLRLVDAFGTQKYGWLIVIGLLACLALGLVGSWRFTRLLKVR